MKSYEIKNNYLSNKISDMEKILDNYYKIYEQNIKQKIELEIIIGKAKKELDKLKSIIIKEEEESCDHSNYRAGHSPFVACICNDCGEEI